MSNPTSKRPAPQSSISSSVHVVITAVLGIMVTALCCYTFYVFRTGATKEQTIADAMKVIQASTEIVSSMAERGLPGIRGRLDEVESRNRMLEQSQRKTLSVIDKLATLPTEAATAADPILTEAAILEARKAARAARGQ